MVVVVVVVVAHQERHHRGEGLRMWNMEEGRQWEEGWHARARCVGAQKGILREI